MRVWRGPAWKAVSMKGRVTRALLALFFALVFSECEDLGEGMPGTGEWALYRLNDPSLTTYQVVNEPLSNLRLAPHPFISVKDVRTYHWGTHEIDFTAEMDRVLDSLAASRGSVSGVPFVVTVGVERIYLGSFWWGYSSMAPSFPYIETISPKPRRIQLPSLGQVGDPRADLRIHHALVMAGILAEEGD